MCLELQRGWVTHGKDTTLPAPSKTLPVPVALLHSKDLGSTDHEFSEYPLDAYVYPPGWMWELQPSTCSHLLQASLTPWSSLTMSCVPRSHSGQGPKTNWWQISSTDATSEIALKCDPGLCWSSGAVITFSCTI